MDHILPALCLGILTNSLLWELQVLQVVAIGTIPLKEDLGWVLRDTVRCLAVVEAFRAALVDMAVVIRCKVAMVALQALVDILLMVKLATTAATRDDHLTYSDATVYPVILCDVLYLLKAGRGKLLVTISR